MYMKSKHAKQPKGILNTDMNTVHKNQQHKVI